MDISTSGFNFTSSIALLCTAWCTGKRFRLNVFLLLDRWSTPMSIPFLCQWLEVIFPDLRFANCRKVWVYIYAKPAAAGGGGAESCLLSIHFGWDSENCSICSVADTAPSPATTTTLRCTTTSFYILCTFAKNNSKKSMFLCTAHAGKLLCLSHVGSLPHFEDWCHWCPLDRKCWVECSECGTTFSAFVTGLAQSITSWQH